MLRKGVAMRNANRPICCESAVAHLNGRAIIRDESQAPFNLAKLSVRCCRAGVACMLACDGVFALAIALLLTAALPLPAFAYVDPSVMTYAIQAFAGVAVALSAVLGVMWRRVRRKVLALLQVDENAGKEVEGAVHRVDPAHPAIEPNIISSAKTRHARQEENGWALSWPKRLAYAALVALFFTFTVLVVAPYELVAGGSGSLMFGLSDVWLPLALAGLCVAVVLSLVLSCVRGKVFDIALLLVFSLGLCAYVQVMTMNGALPSADGRAVDWSGYMGISVVSALMWLAVLVGVLALGHRKRLFARAGAAAVSVFLVLVQAVGVAGLFLAPPAQGADALGDAAATEQVSVTQEGLFDVSSKNNVVVFVLDMFDTRQAQHLMDEYPESFAGLEDFTFFSNVTGSMIPTRYAVPFLLTGQLPEKGEAFSQYLSSRYSRSDFLGAVAEAGYSIGLYSDTLGLEYVSAEDARGLAGLTENLRVAEPPQLDAAGAVLTLWKCALYRDAPWPLKRFFWFYTDEVNNGMVAREDADGSAGTPTGAEGDSDKAVGGSAGVIDETVPDDVAVEGGGVLDDAPASGSEEPVENAVGAGTDLRTLDSAAYTIDDARYYRDLRARGLSSDDQSAGAFRFIHLLGAHYPYSMDENAQDVGVDNSTQDAQSLGALHIVEEYLQQLKAIGAYDNTTVIVTADHGEWYCTMDLEEPTSPLLMVKPADQAQADQTQADQSRLPRMCDVAVSHMDFQVTVLDALGLIDGESVSGPGVSATGAAASASAAGTMASGGYPASIRIANVSDSAPFYAYSLLSLARGDVAAESAFENRMRYYYVTTSDGKHDQQIKQYEITGHALDFTTWRPAGAAWDAQG